jgi:RHS repeat-associated protein
VTDRKFTGKERDAETGLDYFGARYFSSAQGRFTSPDEITGKVGGAYELGGTRSLEPRPLPYADITNPQSLNKYAYALNNPLRYIDPDGHCVEDLCIGEIALAITGTAAAIHYLQSPQGQESVRAAVQGSGILITKAASAFSGLFFNHDKSATPSSAAGHEQEQPAPAAPAGAAKPKANPMTGEPGSTSTTTHSSGDPKQVRRYGKDGYPETDVDHGHDHGQGDPHAHDWTRPTDGTPPTHVDRMPGRPLRPNDPQHQ